MENKILEKIEKLAEIKKLPIVGRQRGQILKDIVTQDNKKVILEIGTLMGYSAILMAECLPENGFIITIEKNLAVAKIAQQNIIDAGYDKKIFVLIGRAQEIIPTLEYKFDMVFLDAAKGEYLEYLKLVENKITEGSVIVSDNVKKLSFLMDDFLFYLRSSSKYENKTIEFGSDAVEISKVIF